MHWSLCLSGCFILACQDVIFRQVARLFVRFCYACALCCSVCIGRSVKSNLSSGGPSYALVTLVLCIVLCALGPCV